MKNKLIIGTLIAVLLIGGLYAWSQGAPSEPNVDENSSNTAQNTDTQPQTGLEFFDDYPEGTIKIDPSQIIAGTDKASDHAPLLADSSHGLARDSYAIVASRAYADWTQYYESYLPHFTDELPTAMGESVAQYYAQRYQTELADADQYCATFASGGILYDQPFEKQKYYFSDYTSRLVGDYLVVGFHTEAYAGGAHPSHLIFYDTFTATGERMSQNNIFASDQAYAQALGPLITAWQQKIDVESDIFGTGPYTGSRSDDIQFYLAEDGVHFVFNEYDIAPYAYGPVDLVVPYSQTLISL